MIPFEKTRRSPRFVNCRAKKRSRASSAARRGKPWNEVFAASTSTASVSTWTIQYMKPAEEPDGKTPRASCESTDGVPDSAGNACMCTASHDTPRNIAIAIVPRTKSVAAAFRPCGRRNALTPFAIASTPVSAVEPEANARRTTKAVTAPVPAAIGWGTTAWGQLDTAQRVTPVPTRSRIDTTNPYVGSAKSTPASFTPRRLANVISTTQESESASSWPRRLETADVSASTPAATETATVRT